MKCQSCDTEDFDREVSHETLMYNKKSHRVNLCRQCLGRARQNDRQIWKTILDKL